MLDFYNIDSVLSEDERAVRDSVRRFVDERVLPIIGKYYVEGRFPKEILPELAHLGNELLREPALHVGVADDGEDALVDESADAVANSALLFAERAVDVEEVEHGARVGVTLPAKANQPSRAARRPSVCEPSARPGRVASTRRA